MRSYYGNLLHDTLETVFSVVSVLLIWISYENQDKTPLFAFSAFIFILPRILSVINDIDNNGYDKKRHIVGLISLAGLIGSFFIVISILLKDHLGTLSSVFNLKVAYALFCIFTSMSLFSLINRVLIGYIQKISISIKNSKGDR